MWADGLHTARLAYRPGQGTTLSSSLASSRSFLLASNVKQVRKPRRDEADRRGTEAEAHGVASWLRRNECSNFFGCCELPMSFALREGASLWTGLCRGHVLSLPFSMPARPPTAQKRIAASSVQRPSRGAKGTGPIVSVQF